MPDEECDPKDIPNGLQGSVDMNPITINFSFVITDVVDLTLQDLRLSPIPQEEKSKRISEKFGLFRPGK